MSKPEGMSDDDDPAALAKRFLDLWQEEIAGTGRDEGPGALTLRLGRPAPRGTGAGPPRAAA